MVFIIAILAFFMQTNVLFFSQINATDRPHKNCYWVEENRFLAGEYPGHISTFFMRQRLKRYLDAGINFFIDLTEPKELQPYEQILQEVAAAKNIIVTYIRMPIKDMSIPTVEFMNEIISVITKALENNKKIYVHCWGGIGRTGTVVGSYLKSKGMTGDEALEQIKQWWKTVAKSVYHPKSPQSARQIDFIKSYIR